MAENPEPENKVINKSIYKTSQGLDANKDAFPVLQGEGRGEDDIYVMPEMGVILVAAAQKGEAKEIKKVDSLINIWRLSQVWRRLEYKGNGTRNREMTQDPEAGPGLMQETPNRDLALEPSLKKKKTSEYSTVLVLCYRKTKKIHSNQLENDQSRENSINPVQEEVDEGLDSAEGSSQEDEDLDSSEGSSKQDEDLDLPEGSSQEDEDLGLSEGSSQEDKDLDSAGGSSQEDKDPDASEGSSEEGEED
ncbi:sperm protein associated with the nucleus on the X chromosome N2-like [Pongo pygmaeus]|uniref:sperm protein associated with the nucleus on the X chromosome N2-like n=1 Tax=Pongo pygmaeus TaxID=9600 RepID=UPI0023E30BCD|nr:sperm protein associated with the nucleus on the X chromosome N2-like [Pongo pygmaeus]